MSAGQQQAELMQGAGGRRQRSGGRQRKGAGAGRDQQREDDPEGALRVDLPPDQADDAGHHQHHQQKPLGDAVSQFGELGFVALGAFQQADNGGQPGVVAQCPDLHGQRAFDIEGAGGNRIAGTAWKRQVFPVRTDSSTLDCPLRITPSAGINPPGCTSTGRRAAVR